MRHRCDFASVLLLGLILTLLATASQAQLFSFAEMQAGRAGIRDTLAIDEGETSAQIAASTHFSNPDNPERVLTFSGEARARAAFGSLGAYARGTVENPFTDPEGEYNALPQEFFLFGQAEFVDQITFTPSGPDAGEGYTTTFTYTVEGSATGDYSYGAVLFTLNGDSEAFEIQSGGTITSQPHEIAWNTPVELVTSLHRASMWTWKRTSSRKDKPSPEQPISTIPSR